MQARFAIVHRAHRPPQLSQCLLVGALGAMAGKRKPKGLVEANLREKQLQEEGGGNASSARPPKRAKGGSLTCALCGASSEDLAQT
jgi:hypothetical protein